MNKYKIVAIPIVLAMWIGMNLMFMQYARDAYQELQERDLDAIVNYSVDAAIDELVLNTADLNMDYADFQRISVEPTVALDTFSIFFLKNYDMSLSRENYTLVKTKFLPAFVVSAYDGYYIAQPQVINSSGARDAIFSVKQPYLYSQGINIYALNLGLEDAKLFDGGGFEKVAAPVSKEEQRSIINSNVSDALMSTVYAQKEGKMLSTIYVPSEMTKITRTNPIENVTVMAYVTNIDTGYGRKMESFGIGGARVTHEEFVGCYVKGGIKMYAYTKYIPATVTVIETFENPMLAAQHGYYFDVDYMQN